MSEESIIRLVGVTKAFGAVVVLKDVNLDIQQGRSTVVIGPSGCGKTVLLKTIVGLVKPDKGKVFFHDWEISAMNERQLVKPRQRMGFLFQGGALFDSMTVEENICFPLLQHSARTEKERFDKCRQVLS